MVKRTLLFFATNLLVVLTAGIILQFVLPMFGVQLGNTAGLAVFCGLFGMGGAFVSLWISRWVAKGAYGIQLLEEGHALHTMVARLARDAGLPKTPEVGVYRSPEPNAFATGPTRSRALVAFSSGLLENMEQSEIEAVAGHEIAHVANGDMVTMALLQGVANALVMFIARIVAHAIDGFLRDSSGRGGLGFFGYMAVVFVLDSALMFLAYIPIAWFSRRREFRADRGSAELTSPRAMSSALRRLETITANARAPKESEAMAMAKIHSRRRVSLWSTHPSVDERVRRLELYTG